MLKSRDISKLRADVAVNCRTFVSLCKKEGLPVLVTETVRDAEYQASLYAKGRTEPGSIVTNQKTPSFNPAFSLRIAFASSLVMLCFTST